MCCRRTGIVSPSGTFFTSGVGLFGGLPVLLPLHHRAITLSLTGIDTPEIKGKCEREKMLAREARDFVRDILGQSSKVEFRKAERDKYFRINAWVIADG